MAQITETWIDNLGSPGSYGRVGKALSPIRERWGDRMQRCLEFYIRDAKRERPVVAPQASRFKPTPEDFAAKIAQCWEQIRPLTEAEAQAALHAHG